ncbi:hypothetical protein BV22DRAFT_1045013 [Leucogyrophana mollusca]|uniref:Uncharacterized protein n=1 Tax=Leucogyrophana mollusca TaxID=85980 RepID=A0ACB8BPS9_9AGAM|nr:hypothetical protein BV22DRAFT_1045013 [Leucogyrophana mollusca]
MVVGTALQIFNLMNPNTSRLLPVRYGKLESSLAPSTCQTAGLQSAASKNVLQSDVLDKGNAWVEQFLVFQMPSTRSDTKYKTSIPWLRYQRHLVSSCNGIFSTCALEAAPGPVSATTFNGNGTMFAYAVSYDWF